MPVTGWKLDAEERKVLLERFPPLWPHIIADHVTLDAKASEQDPLPDESSAHIVGSISDGAGLQALIVAIGGTTGRPDGSTYHITWSLDRSRGRAAVESNDVIADRGWNALDDPVPIRLIPARF
ncbi:hypothetical protein L288_04045 [Sphingobium quisquiliarum P25]|uniref:Uncharacterized protein n=1 Tax=Sphingobium quisquiliarum P25 TaxID=1329909 RepID=T0H295_9SPHN|nr:hypothetical protein [Sphingobium quisquiliarum]EQB10461.1 hypothetical protein L288_04045 [Sphingobium quisquiliarum P25]